MADLGYTAIAKHFGYPESDTFHQILEKIFTPSEALMVAELPSLPEQIAAKLQLEREAVEQALERLTRKGILIHGSKGYRLSWRVVELRDMYFQDPELDPDRLNELADLWERFAGEGWYRDVAAQMAATETPQVRILPAIKAVGHDPHLPPDQDIREILKTREVIGVGLCPCRRQNRSHRAKGDQIREICLLFDKWAAAGLKRGVLRQVSYEEALRAIDVAEEEGMVHTTGVTEKAWLCNCGRDYCVNLVPLREHAIPLDRALVKSAYQPAIDDAECNGCQVCVDYCPFEAIEMVKVAGSRRLKAAADLGKCRGCGICAINCNVEAIAMTQVAAIV